MFKKFKFAKGFKKNIKKAMPKKETKKDDNYVFGVGGTYNLCGQLNDEGKMEFRLTMSGEWDTRKGESLDRHVLLQMQKEIEELIRKTDPMYDEINK